MGHCNKKSMSSTKKGRKRPSKYGGGNSLTPSPYPNTLYNPSAYASNVSKVAGHGCAGTRVNTEAAKGKYVPYGMKGGGVCLNNTPNYSTVISPRAGYANIKPCGSNIAVNPASMGAGQVAEVGQGAHARAFPFKGGARKRKSNAVRKRKTARKSKVARKRKTARKNKAARKSKVARKRKTARRSRKRYRGGSGQPYSNVPISFGYGLGAPLPNGQSIAAESSMANPPPFHVYDHCPSK